MKKILVIVVLLFVNKLIVAQRAFTDNQLKNEFPKKAVKYKLAKMPFELADTLSVSTNSIYVYQRKTNPNDPKHINIPFSYKYMRFFEDGRVYISFAYLGYPTTAEFNDLGYGKFGRYLVNDNKITIEFYMGRQYGVMFMFAHPVPTGIQFYASSGSMRPLFVEKDTTGGYYRKHYANLYNWPDSIFSAVRDVPQGISNDR